MNPLAGLTRFLVPSPCYLCGMPSVDDSGLCPRCAAALLAECDADPPRCPQCAIRVGEVGQICPGCMRHPPHFDFTIAGQDFQAANRYLIHQLKYRRDPGVLHALIQPLTFRIEQRYSRRPGNPAADVPVDWPDALVPMPIHPERRRVRGFNQARLIADRVGRLFDLPVHGAAVVRSGSSESQSGLSAIDRRKSLKNAFEVRHALPQHVAIVDDVMTTGSSADALARTLKRSGAQRVSVWVLARTPAPGDIPG
jgi:ComF family protein